MEKECCEEEVQPIGKMDYKPIIYIYKIIYIFKVQYPMYIEILVHVDCTQYGLYNLKQYDHNQILNDLIHITLLHTVNICAE